MYLRIVPLRTMRARRSDHFQTPLCLQQRRFLFATMLRFSLLCKKLLLEACYKHTHRGHSTASSPRFQKNHDVYVTEAVEAVAVGETRRVGINMFSCARRRAVYSGTIHPIQTTIGKSDEDETQNSKIRDKIQNRPDDFSS